jgi:hypothetical protein
MGCCPELSPVRPDCDDAGEAVGRPSAAATIDMGWRGMGWCMLLADGIARRRSVLGGRGSRSELLLRGSTSELLVRGSLGMRSELGFRGRARLRSALESRAMLTRDAGRAAVREAGRAECAEPRDVGRDPGLTGGDRSSSSESCADDSDHLDALGVMLAFCPLGMLPVRGRGLALPLA